MFIKEGLDFRYLNFLKDQNKKMKEEILKEHYHNIKIAEKIEIEIMQTLIKLKGEIGDE